MKPIDDAARKAAAIFLPEAMNAAIKSYSEFLAKKADDNEEMDAKEFKAHHDACKVALAHIDLLLKLAGYVMAGENDLAERKRIDAMIHEAETELRDDDRRNAIKDPSDE